MNSNNHRAIGMLFIIGCLIVAGVLYAVIRSPSAPAPLAVEQTNVSDMHIENALDRLGTQHNDTDLEEAANTAGPKRAGSAGTRGCGEDVCSWSKLLGSEGERADSRGQLVTLSLLEGQSVDPNGPIVWDAKPHTVYVYCSKVLPSVIAEEDGAWKVDVLDFITGVPWMLNESKDRYIKTCHNDDRKFPDDAEALGYIAVSDSNSDISISRPADIKERAGAILASVGANER